MIRYILALAALTCHAAAVPQTVLQRAEKARTEVNDLKNGAARAVYALDQLIAELKKPVPVPTPTPAPSPTPAGPPYFTAAERAARLVPTGPVGSADPDVVGAFRFICTPGPLNFDDAIVFPGQIGASPHLHQNYGNLLISGKSTHDTLLAAGESTCSNALNRSAYWVPALLTGDDKNVIRPDWINIYYKRLPASDPNCLKMALKGCVGLPVGLRVLSGFDMKRMGEAQPENATFSHRCASDGKPSVHRQLLAEAVKDCGGSGLIVSQINFPNCWSGELDSPDHRKHLTWPVWDNGDSGTPWPGPCPKTHPYLIPELAQLVAYTIEASDGDIHFASDRMPGMAMPGGSTFHADYIEAWDDQTRKTWERNCLDRKLSCSDGVLGDGTMLKRGPLTYKAEPRLVPVPARPT